MIRCDSRSNVIVYLNFSYMTSFFEHQLTFGITICDILTGKTSRIRSYVKLLPQMVISKSYSFIEIKFQNSNIEHE